MRGETGKRRREEEKKRGCVRASAHACVRESVRARVWAIEQLAIVIHLIGTVYQNPAFFLSYPRLLSLALRTFCTHSTRIHSALSVTLFCGSSSRYYSNGNIYIALTFHPPLTDSFAVSLFSNAPSLPRWRSQRPHSFLTRNNLPRFKCLF